MRNHIPMTRQGFDALSEELAKLKRVDRQNIIKEIAAAREHGDLSENAEYDAAKERQGQIENRIGDLEFKLANANVIDLSALPEGKVVFGVTVELEDEESGDSVRYQIVGPDEADIKEGKISVQAPLARALIGHTADDSVEVKTPRGTKNYTIISIERTSS